MTIYIVDLEKLETRYTQQWATHVPNLIKQHGHDVIVISGPDNIPSVPTPGMFLNFAATNVYKASQVEKISRLFCEGKIKDGDYFLFTDAWHPGVINLKYMIELLGINATIGGLWHAGSYDKWDGLGRLIGNKPWVRYAEQSFYHAFDHNYFATEFHVRLFMEELLNNGLVNENPWFEEEWTERYNGGKIVRTGWPMEYMGDTLASYKNITKRNLILFPHRIAPEKQVDIFRDLSKNLPQYEFIVCQDHQLTKHQYHTLLGEAKMVFSANLQETLGISTCAEGPLVNALPVAPDRLSYSEIFKNHRDFLYPSEWTQDWDHYLIHKIKLIELITHRMNTYDQHVLKIKDFVDSDYKQYFYADRLLKNLK